MDRYAIVRPAYRQVASPEVDDICFLSAPSKQSRSAQRSFDKQPEGARRGMLLQHTVKGALWSDFIKQLNGQRSQLRVMGFEITTAADSLVENNGGQIDLAITSKLTNERIDAVQRGWFETQQLL